MTLLLETGEGFVPYVDQLIGEPPARHPPNVEQLWSAQDLEAIGLWRDDMIAPADDVPEGKFVTETTVQRVDGVAKFVNTLADIVIPVPVSVTRRQARLALLQAGLLDLVEVAIEAMPEPARSAARIEWEDATEIRRDHALIAALADEVGLTSERLDELFIAAARI